MFGTLPLAEGYRPAVTTFDMWSNREATTAFTVTGSETVQAGSRKTDAWVVVSQTGLRRWIAKDSGAMVQAGLDAALDRAKHCPKIS